MPKRRQLLVSLGIAGLLSIGLASVVTAHPHHGHPFRHFDNIRIDHQGTNAFTATPGHRDLVLGLGGDDVINSLDKHDHVLGGNGDDTIDTGEGRDLALGGTGHDRITGGPHPDDIHAGRGDDTIHALDGAVDRVRCGPGEDSYTADPQDRIARDCENDITPTP
jgi:RTX calcium-binding nonapeptide repeat (4 copies)